MQKFGKRYIILITILGIFAGIILLIQYGHFKERIDIDISKMPLNVGEWNGEEVPVDEEIKDILETESVLMRKYTNLKGEKLALSVVYYKDSRVALHLPEGCMTGKGTKIAEKRVQKIEISGEDSFYAIQMVTTSNKGDVLVLYYFETGNLRTNNYIAFRWQMLLNKLKSKSNSGALVRFSIPIRHDLNESIEVLKHFIGQIGPELSKYLI